MGRLAEPISIEEIAGLSDPVLRNLLITQRYHEFAVDLRDGGVKEDATWCAFAVWASKTAGATIRGEVLPQRAREIIVEHKDSRHLLRRLTDRVGAYVNGELSRAHLERVAKAVTDDVSAAIADGNRLVFAELAPLFTAVITARKSMSEPSSAAIVASLQPVLDSLQDAEDTAGVAEAIRGYADALCSPDRKACTVLRANVLAVAHEQKRLQPNIETALDAAVTDTFKRVIQGDVADHLRGKVRAALDAMIDDVSKDMDTAWDTVLTETIMRLVTKSEVFDLHEDITPLSIGKMFPVELEDLTGTVAAPTVAEWDTTGGTGTPSGADDWADLHKRMNFIVNLFRSRQREATLFDPPYDDDQIAALDRREVPAPPL
jgi:hypothetical protein